MSVMLTAHPISILRLEHWADLREITPIGRSDTWHPVLLPSKSMCSLSKPRLDLSFSGHL